jgi:hypothetical protein
VVLMAVPDRERAEIANRSRPRITRADFLYMEPKGEGDAFAQCGTCAFGHDRCGLMGGRSVSAENGSCGAYIEGTPDGDIYAHLTPSILGYVERQVRCEDCRFGAQRCALYVELNEKLPHLFALEEIIHPKGCCNAQKPKAR